MVANPGNAEGTELLGCCHAIRAHAVAPADDGLCKCQDRWSEYPRKLESFAF
jgi:hypothetical protein